MRALRGLGLLCWLALPAQGEIYRCEDASGAVHFTGDPAGCAHAVEYTPRAVLQPAQSPALVPQRPAEPPASELPDFTALFADPPGAGWEVLDEPPQTSIRDAELRELGLRASQARHYTRARGPVSEVCTIELWAFERAAQAATASRVFEREGWQHVAVGDLLVLAHGVRLERNVGSQQQLVEGCTELAEATRARAARR